MRHGSHMWVCAHSGANDIRGGPPRGARPAALVSLAHAVPASVSCADAPSSDAPCPDVQSALADSAASSASAGFSLLDISNGLIATQGLASLNMLAFQKGFSLLHPLVVA